MADGVKHIVHSVLHNELPDEKGLVSSQFARTKLNVEKQKKLIITLVGIIIHRPDWQIRDITREQ